MSSAAKITPIGIGGMLVTDNVVATELPVQGTWVKVVTFDEVQQERGGMVVDVVTDNDIVVDHSGVYEIFVPTSFTDSSQKTYELVIAINDSVQLKTRARTNFNSASDTRFLVPHGILDLDVGDALSMFARCIDGSNQEVTIEDCTFSVKLLLLLPN